MAFAAGNQQPLSAADVITIVCGLAIVIQCGQRTRADGIAIGVALPRI
jgi:hypothetical protein